VLHETGEGGGSNRASAAVALAALVLYPMAILLPMLRIEELGHHRDASVVQGVTTLLGSGHLFVGVVVLVCSVVLPLGKLFALLALSLGGGHLRQEHRAWTYRLVEWTGRWGMLDVLLVAILVAAVKVGDWVEVTAGPAALAFTLVVLLSLIAVALFDPHALWDAGPQQPSLDGCEATASDAATLGAPAPSADPSSLDPSTQPVSDTDDQHT
jgi:uncharacterized paraquat-inducible protein A